MSKERAKRKQARHDGKRAAIFAVAKRVFLREGLEGASLRAIARACNYAPGALYAYYASKEEIYADILRDSLGRLQAATERGAAAKEPRRALRGAVRAFYRFYRDNPHDLDLSLYISQGLGPRGLTPELDRELNERLGLALQALADALMRVRPTMSARQCKLHQQILLSALMGVLLLERTGRLSRLDADPAKLLDRHIELTFRALAE
ncbi:MAG: TetR/AcrR family transcriptional regulator [Reyranellaceae bacterium]